MTTKTKVVELSPETLASYLSGERGVLDIELSSLLETWVNDEGLDDDADYIEIKEMRIAESGQVQLELTLGYADDTDNEKGEG